MAERFDFSEIVVEDSWTVILPNAEGVRDKFYDILIKELEKTNFPNLDYSIQEYVTGGLIFSKEQTKMLRLKAKSSQFKKYETYFRAQPFGNVIQFSILECMEKGFLGTITGKTGPELWAIVRSRCKNMAQYEEFTALNNLGEILFQRALILIDPEYKERKTLRTIK